MKSTTKYKYYITLFATVLGFGVVSLNQIDAAGKQELTTSTDLETIAQETVENPMVTAIQPRAINWDISTYSKLQDHPQFIDRAKIAEPIDNKYAFNLSRTARTEFLPKDVVKVNPNAGNGNYIELSAMNIGDTFYITNCGYYQGHSLDLKVTIKDMIFKPQTTLNPNEEKSLNLMVNDFYFAGMNFFGVGYDNYPGEINMVELEYTTIDSDTKAPVVTSGVLPYNNTKNTSKMSLNRDLITNIYGVEKSVVRYKEDPGSNLVSFSTDAPNGGAILPIGPERSIPILYDDKATRTFKYETDRSDGYTMDVRSPIPVALPLSQLKGNEYVKDPQMYYEITQMIPLEPVELAFKDFSFEFPLESVIADVDLTKIQVETDRVKLVYGTDFAVHTKKVGDKETVSIEILKAFRDKGTGSNLGLNFYGRTITAKMPVELDDTKDLTPYLSKDKTLIRVPLTVTTKIDDFYKPITSNEAFAEMTNEGKLTVSHVDEQGRKLIPDGSMTDILGTIWPETYTDNGGYVKDKITLNGQKVDEISIKAFTNPYEVSFIDNRYAFSLNGTSPNDATGATAAQEEEISYKLKVASSAKQSYVTPNVNHYQTTKVSLAGTNLALLDNHGDAELQLADGTLVATASYDAGNQGYSFTTLSPVTWDNDLYVVFKARVKSDAAIGQIISMQPKVEFTFDADALSFAGESSVFDTEVVKARLEFESHPDKIDFGQIVRATFGGEKVYPIKTMGSDLVIRDERVVGNNNGWRISATLKDDFTATDGSNHTLPSILKYKEGAQLKDLDKNQKVLIYNKYTDGKKLTNISENWVKNQEGLVLKLFSGKAKNSDYTATVEWELEDAY